MNKKFIFLLLLPLCACSSSFSLDSTYYNELNYGLVEDNDYNLSLSAINNKESFAIYLYTLGCSTCYEFKPIVEEFLKDNYLMMYSVNFSIFKEKDSKNAKKVLYSPSVLLFKDGKLKAYLDPNSNEDTLCYKDIEAFSNWFNNYIIK